MTSLKPSSLKIFTSSTIDSKSLLLSIPRVKGTMQNEQRLLQPRWIDVNAEMELWLSRIGFMSPYVSSTDSCKANDIGREHVVLVEGHSKRSTEERVQLTGKNDGFKRCVFTDSFVDSSDTSHNTTIRQVKSGDFVVVKALDAGVSTLQCEVLRFA